MAGTLLSKRNLGKILQKGDFKKLLEEVKCGKWTGDVRKLAGWWLADWGVGSGLGGYRLRNPSCSEGWLLTGK